MPQLELVALTQQEDQDYHVEDKIVRNTVKPTLACLAALERIRERMLWRGRFLSFDDYCKQRLKISASTANRQIGAEKLRAALPIGKLQNDAQAGALGAFPSSLHMEIIENVEQEAAGNPITAAMIERIGRRVYEAHNPFLFSAVSGYETEDEEEGEEEEDTANEQVNRAVAQRTAKEVPHALERWEDHARQGEKKGRKAVPEDLCIDKNRDTVQRIRAYLSGGLAFLDELEAAWRALGD